MHSRSTESIPHLGVFTQPRPTDAAGGLVDAGTLARIAQAGGDWHALLADNDSHRALALAGDLVVTGPTGTNVADIQLIGMG